MYSPNSELVDGPQGERLKRLVRQKGMTGIVRGGLTAVVLLVAVSACGSVAATAPVTSIASPSPSPSAARLSVTLTRTGGLAGANDRVVINPDGAWVRTDRAGTQKRGQLSADQITELQRLANDPELMRESSLPSAKVTCADGRTYSLSAGTATVTYTDCTSARPEVAMQLVGLIATWALG
jgi:hypothetical protein